MTETAKMDAAIDIWLASFSDALHSGDVASVTGLFEPQGFWRDLLSFTWNIKTLEGHPQITAMVAACVDRIDPRSFQRDGPATDTPDGVAAWFTFETFTALGKGRLTIRNGLCHVLLTTMEDLKGYEEAKGTTRPLGIVHKADKHRKTWSEQRAETAARLGIDEQPEVLIIGGGQGGMALAARLKQLGVPTLVAEQNPRIGDSWRNRYRSLVLHDPVWYDHLPYLPFPENWPVFCPKDKIGDWLAAYASIFELDTWTSTRCTSASWDEGTSQWTVDLNRDGKHATIKPQQLVFCTGAYGPPRRPKFEGQDNFGGTVLHSSGYTSGAKYKGKRVLVVGAGSSAHDVSVDLWEAGAQVTMFQRRPSIVVRSETLMKHGFDIYSEDALARGITTEMADLLSAATPFALFGEKQKDLYQTIKAEDADFYDRLAAAGFDFDFGEDDTGLMMRALRTASGYYIDVGASELIANGEIGIIAGEEIDRLTKTGVLFASGKQIEVDIIIACTGYESMNEAVANIVDRKTADRVGPCWGLGSGIRGDPGPWLGELRNMWKPTAQEALWFHGGNLALSRFYSKYVALQLKARQVGIAVPVYDPPVSQEK